LHSVSQADEQRLLAARSELGYVSDPHRALRSEPEAVDAATQERFSLAAHRAQEQRQRDQWARTHRTISGALQAFEACHPDRRVMTGVRAIEREARRVDRRVGL
jgi:hypothetical protein